MDDGQLWCSSGSLCAVPNDKKGLKLQNDHKLCIGDLCVSKPEFEKLKRTPETKQEKTFTKPAGWNSSLNIDAPVNPESLYSLHFGDGKDLHGRLAGIVTGKQIGRAHV